MNSFICERVVQCFVAQWRLSRYPRPKGLPLLSAPDKYKLERYIPIFSPCLLVQILKWDSCARLPTAYELSRVRHDVVDTRNISKAVDVPESLSPCALYRMIFGVKAPILWFSEHVLFLGQLDSGYRTGNIMPDLLVFPLFATPRVFSVRENRSRSFET